MPGYGTACHCFKIRISVSNVVYVRLGEGSFGTVFKGKYQGRTVALKMAKVFSQEEIKEFLEEAEISVKLPKNKNILQLIGVAIRDGRPILVLEYVGGGTLLELFEKEDVGFAEMHKILVGIAKGMATLHAHGLLLLLLFFFVLMTR